MLSRVSILQWVIVVFSLVTVSGGLVLLLTPLGANLPGDGQNSSALTASVALIVVVVGLILTVYMQSAEYRRQAEIIDGLQEIRIILTIMAARVSLARTGGDADHSISAEERAVLLNAVKGPAGRFLNYMRGVKDKEAGEANAPTRWRTIFLNFSMVVYATDIGRAGQNVIDLLQVVDDVTVKDIKKYASKVISADSIDKIRAYEDDIIVRALKSMYAEQAQRAIDPADMARLEGMIAGLQAVLMQDAQGRAGWAELQKTLPKARAGDPEAFNYIASLYGALVAPDDDEPQG
ncbi:hypothetical protein [Hyphomonas sp.]|uniref:hypothetical protein n=1 Tax=Hyphomonas sp. TaxID=87 RepID=UPI00391AECA4